MRPTTYVFYRLKDPWMDFYQTLQGVPWSFRDGLGQKKNFIRPQPGVQGQKGVPRVGLQPQPCILEKSSLNKSCRASQRMVGRI